MAGVTQAETVTRLDIRDPQAPRPDRRPELVLLDLDGTCVDASLRMHPRTVAAVGRAVERGVAVCVATGRMFRSALPWARLLQVRHPIVCYQGAVVRDLPRPGDPEVDGIPIGRLLFEDALGGDLCLRALRIARSHGWHFQTYRDEQLLCEQDRPEGREYARIAQVPIRLVDDLEPVVAGGSVKVICVIDDEPGALQCEEEMRSTLGDAAKVARSLPPYVEVVDRDAGKGRAMLRLCAHLGIDPAATLAIGDAPNDIDMFDAAAFSVSVRDRRAEVVAAARATCAPPEEAGVADVLEALGIA